VGADNEHPGYAGLHTGDSHLVELIKAIKADSKDWASTAIVVTYDEFGGQWDHVPPPTSAPISDRWGPGTRIPAMMLSPQMPRQGRLDNTTYDTPSILTMIEARFGLSALASRDAASNDFGNALRPGLLPLAICAILRPIPFIGQVCNAV
jgi:phospholipase C